MLYKSIVVVLSIFLVSILVKSCTSLLDWNVKTLSSENTWAKVLSIETMEHERSYKMGGGTVVTWNVTVKIDDKTSIVYLTVGPPPKIGHCLPITAQYLSNGKVLAFINDQEWRYGTSYGICD